MSILVVFLLALFFTLLGLAYVKGYDMVKARSPENLARFYLVMAAIRMLLVATGALLCIILSPNREDAVPLVLTYIIMYATMMVVTLIVRH